MRDRFKAKNERSWKLRFHTQTAGVSLTAQQPYNNVVRTALQALAAVLGGTNSLHTNSLDEALALPTAEAATLALRTQQIIAHESGVTNIVDPLGGSYFVERLTLDMEREAQAVLRDHRPHGRHGRGDRAGLPAAGDRRSVVPLPAGGRERASKIIVGVNDFVQEDEAPMPILYIDESTGGAAAGAARGAAADARQRRASRRALDALEAAARGTRQHDVSAARLRPRLRDRRRDVRCAPRGLGRIRGSAVI